MNPFVLDHPSCRRRGHDPAYGAIFAVGMLLFVTTLVMNIFAQWLLARFREEYD